MKTFFFVFFPPFPSRFVIAVVVVYRFAESDEGTDGAARRPDAARHVSSRGCERQDGTDPTRALFSREITKPRRQPKRAEGNQIAQRYRRRVMCVLSLGAPLHRLNVAARISLYVSNITIKGKIKIP